MIHHLRRICSAYSLLILFGLFYSRTLFNYLVDLFMNVGFNHAIPLFVASGVIFTVRLITIVVFVTRCPKSMSLSRTLSSC